MPSGVTYGAGRDWKLSGIVVSGVFLVCDSLGDVMVLVDVALYAIPDDMKLSTGVLVCGSRAMPG